MKRNLTKLLLLFVVMVVGVLSANAQKDVTSQYITNATLSSLDGWTNVNFNTPVNGYYRNTNNGTYSNATTGYATECYEGWDAVERSEYSLTQTITLPAGHYTLVNYSFFREGQDYNTDAATSRAFLKAGNNKVAVKTLGSITPTSYANSQWEAAGCFDSKMYRNTLDFTITANNTQIEIGVYGTFNTEITRSWMILGQFELIANDIKATPDAPFDVTGYITNPGFEYRDMSGWTLSPEGSFGTHNGDQAFKTAWFFAEKWQSSNDGPLSARSMSQTVNNLPAGLYKLTANVGGDGTYIKLNNKTTNGSAETADISAYSVIESGQSLTITAGKTDAGSANWIHFDNFRLHFCGDVAAMLSELSQEATDLKDSPMNADTKQALLTAINGADNPADAVGALDAINEAITNAKSSIALYEKIKVNIDEAKGIYTTVDATDIEGKYNDGLYANDYEPSKIFSEFTKLYNASHAEGVTPGTDFTGGIYNPSFELGNTHGWTHGTSSDTGAKEAKDNYATTGIEGKYIFNTWWQGVPITQTIENLPNGVYRISAVVASGDGNDPGMVFLTANDEKVGIVCPRNSGGEARPGELNVTVTNNTLTIGAVGATAQHTYTAAGHWWYKVDNFRLTYLASSIDDYIDNLANTLDEAAAASFKEAEAVVAKTDIEAIDAAYQAAIRTQKTEGADYTGAIVNPSFETGDTRGWTYETSNDHGAKKNEEGYSMTNGDGNYLFNIWSSGNTISQTITDLPNGLYKLTVVAATDADHSVLLTGNGASKEIAATDKESGIEGELTFAVTDGNAIIGAEGKDKYWYKVDDFRLEYVGGIEKVDNITDLTATTGEAIFSMTDWEVIVAGEDSIIAQNMTSETPAGIMLKGTKTVSGANTAAIDKVISGQVYGTYDADTHVFTVKTNSGNKFEAVNGTTALTKRDIAVATQPGNVYLYTVIEDATIVKKEDNFYATVGDDEILIDKHFNADLVLNDGDVVNSITGITLLNEDGASCAIAPFTQDDIVPVLWSAEDIEEGEVKDDSNPIDLTKGKELNRMKNLAAGDVLKVKVVEDNHMDSRGQRRAIALRGTIAVTTRSDLGVFYIPFEVYEESTTVEVPITADIQKEANEKGLKIAVKGANASMVTVSNAVYTAEETENSIWLSKDAANEVTLGEYHFGDVRKNDVLTAEGDGAKMAIIVENGDDIEVTSGEALSEEQAAALQDNELSVKDATKVVFTLGDDPRNDKFEVPENEDGTYDSFAQGAQVTGVDGMIMTFGGNDPEGAAYEFEEAYPEVNKFGSVTEGINTFPVDNEDKPYDPEVKNLPTKGTYYVFEPTKDGKLDVTVGLEQGKKLFVTEDGEALKDFNGITKVNNNLISFPVEATKTYYVFANETNLEYYGFTFVPTTDCENIAKDIATFKLVPQDNADGDTLLLKDAVVTYINGDDIFVEDASGATTFFRTNIQFYVGQKLNGYIIGQNHEREFLPQLLKVEGKTTYKTFEVTENVTPEAKVISVADASKEENIGRFVKLENLEVSKDDHGFTVLFDPETENSIRIEDHFNVFYTLNRIVRSAEGIVGVNKEGTIIFWPTSKEGVDSPNPLFTEGYYVFRNVASGLYLGAGNSWGTQATLLDYSESQKLIGIDDFTYKMESQVSNGGTSYYFNGSYMDGNSAAELTFAKKDDYYTISVGGKFLGNSTTAAYTTGQYALGLDVDGESEDALWEVVPATKAALAKATEEAPMDATFMIKNPNFGRNNRNSSAWTMEASNKNLCGGKDENKCAESWHAVFTLSQKLENMPKGVYELTAQGFYGQDGSDNEHLPVFYANDATQTFQKRTGSENSMDLASQSFAKGLYKSEPIFFELAGDGDITIGTKLEGNTALWCIWDNFQLKYYGPDASFAAIKNAAILAQLDELRKKAADLAEVVDFASAKTALDNALNSTADVDRTSETAINAAIVTLNGAIAEGDTYKKAKNALAHMKELTESTNFYTKESYDKYYSTWLAKYEDGTLTKDEANTLQDPTVVTTWHAQITVDDMLLSVWDTNPDFQDAPYYINTWSVEGDSDGSNFHVPFFEYWTGDGNSLETKTLTATVNGLEAGAYDVTAWVRVRMKNGAEAPAYGIEMQVNNGTPVDVAAGQQVGTTQFYLDNFTASGIVGADGVLTLKFNVAEDNNISWLSFKNVKYTGSSTDGISDVVRYKSGAVYNLNGQKVNKDLKPGLYIINGQKRVVK